MTAATPHLHLEPSPTVPGGGPASRRRPSRITSAFAWTWLALILACPVVVATVVLASARHGGVTTGGITVLLITGLVLLILLCGVYAAGMAAVESRVDDDMRTYGVGARAVLHTRRGVAAWFGDAPVEVDGRGVGHVAREFGPDGRRATLVLGGCRYRWVASPGRWELHDDADEVVASAVGHAYGPRRDWEIEVDGRLLRLRQHVERPLPRRTLIDDRGRAWLARLERRRVEVRLPRELTDLGAAFCLMVLAELREIVVTPGTGTATEVEDGWLDAAVGTSGDWDSSSSSDWSWSDSGSSSGSDSGSSSDWSWSDGGSSWSDGGSSSGSDSSWW